MARESQASRAHRVLKLSMIPVVFRSERAAERYVARRPGYTVAMNGERSFWAMPTKDAAKLVRADWTF